MKHFQHLKHGVPHHRLPLKHVVTPHYPDAFRRRYHAQTEYIAVF